MHGTEPNVRFDRVLIERYGGRGPRYTSYPTALQFHEGFTAARYEQAVRLSNQSARPLSLYVHIPFCRSLCYYCACNKIVTRNAARVHRYLDRLRREIDMQAALLDTGRTVKQLHFGGGTPTYLDNEQLRNLVAHIAAAFHLESDTAREFSIEVDPRTVDSYLIVVLAGLGFNRLSLGVQDFAPEVQSAVNRIQSSDDVASLVEAARSAGFASISFDLIYGLPRQSAESFDRTLDRVIAIRPDRLAVYNYAHLPSRFKGQRMIGEAGLPSPDEKLKILKLTIDRLSAAGYLYIGMDHFALPGDALVRARRDRTLQRNFQGYSTHGDCDLIGLGVSAIGKIGDAYAQNATTTAEYSATIDADRLAVRRGIAVDADDRLRAKVIQELMCYGRIAFDDFGRRNGVDFAGYFAAELKRLEPLADDGLVLRGREGIRVSATGRLLLRSIAMIFDRYLAVEAGDERYSKAI